MSFEQMLKVVLLSHSSETNLSRDWPETVSIAVQGLECYPCHRIHTDMKFCTMDAKSRGAACQAAIKPEQVDELVGDYFAWLDNQQKVAA